MAVPPECPLLSSLTLYQPPKVLLLSEALSEPLSAPFIPITHHTPLPRSTGLHLLFMFSGCLSPGTPHSKHTQVKNFRGWGQGQCYLHLAQQQLALSSEHGWDLIDLLIDCWY